MKRENEITYRFDWKSVYLVPLMALAISVTLIIAVVKTSESQDVANYTKNTSNVHKATNLLADAKIL